MKLSYQTFCIDIFHKRCLDFVSQIHAGLILYPGMDTRFNAMHNAHVGIKLQN